MQDEHYPCATPFVDADSSEPDERPDIPFIVHRPGAGYLLWKWRLAQYHRGRLFPAPWNADLVLRAANLIHKRLTAFEFLARLNYHRQRNERNPNG